MLSLPTKAIFHTNTTQALWLSVSAINLSLFLSFENVKSLVKKIQGFTYLTSNKSDLRITASFSPSTGDAELQFRTLCWVPTERGTENRDSENICELCTDCIQGEREEEEEKRSIHLLLLQTVQERQKDRKAKCPR